MKICAKNNTTFFIKGNIYKSKHSNNIYIATGEGNKKINLKTGNEECSSFVCFEDVTDKYCLSEI